MTYKEKLIVSAYTGVLMTEWSKFHEFVQDVMGRPVWTHEFASKEFMKELKLKVKDDFLKLCDGGIIR